MSRGLLSGLPIELCLLVAGRHLVDDGPCEINSDVDGRSVQKLDVRHIATLRPGSEPNMRPVRERRRSAETIRSGGT